MDITHRDIAGHDIPDTHEKLVKLNPQERVQARKDLCNELKWRVEMYVYGAIKKVGKTRCVFAAPSSGKSKGYLEHICSYWDHHFSHLKI